MRIRINVNSLKNAMGTVFLLAAAFFVCSTFISMRSVFADPIAPTNSVVQTSGRVSPRSTAATRTNVSRATVSRANNTTSKATVSRGTASRSVSSRSITPKRSTAAASSRNVTSRSNAQNRTTTSNRAVRARTSTTPSRVGVNNSVMAGSRASTSVNYSYLSSKLYTGSYANIIDSSTGLIAADAYSNCMESYYACMDEICTARNDTKGRCSCAGRVYNFIAAEEKLEEANEELIKLSGQLSLLIATKGKGKDLSSAFSLTEAEQVMNCVSWQETRNKYGENNNDAALKAWCTEHNFYGSDGEETSNCKPSYCESNSYGFKLSDLNKISGSSSDILAQLKAWADAKDLAKATTENNNENLANIYQNISNIVNQTSVTTSKNSKNASLDSLADKWGYKLFEYAHNNVCGRVLDSCFNGIYEACGTPPSVKDSDGNTHKKCANGLTSSCPYNYNSYIHVTTDNSKLGDVVLNERGSSSATSDTSASCFGYTSTGSTTGTRTTSTTSSDPYYTLRGPVADARRSIMQKYLLDANSACDVYGEALKKTAQNINYQKIAAEQALQQKRLEFKQQADATALSEATAAIDNFNECISEIWDCYEDYEADGWTTARIKAYCSQASQVPHCYETMICSPLSTQLTAVIDLPDDEKCTFSTDYTKNTCRNVVTISEILYGTSITEDISILNLLQGKSSVENISSAALREACLQRALISDEGRCDPNNTSCLRGWKKGLTIGGEEVSSIQDTTEYSISYFKRVDGDISNNVAIAKTSPLSYTKMSANQLQTPNPAAEPGTGETFTGYCVYASVEDMNSDKILGNCSNSSKFIIPGGTTGTIYVVEMYDTETTGE